jgi:hypothetical protein
MPEIEVKYKFTKQEAIFASRQAARAWRLLFYVVPALGALCVFGAVRELLAGGEERGTAMIYLVLGLVMMAAPLLDTWKLRRRIEKLPNLDADMHWRISEDGLSVESPASSSRFEWSLMIKARELQEGFLLYRQPLVVQWLPKHGFTGEEDITRFRELLREKVAQFSGPRERR